MKLALPISRRDRMRPATITSLPSSASNASRMVLKSCVLSNLRMTNGSLPFARSSASFSRRMRRMSLRFSSVSAAGAVLSSAIYAIPLLLFRRGSKNYFAISMMVYFRMPTGASTVIVSPSREPMSALPSGESSEILLANGSASVEPTMENSCSASSSTL